MISGESFLIIPGKRWFKIGNILVSCMYQNRDQAKQILAIIHFVHLFYWSIWISNYVQHWLSSLRFAGHEKIDKRDSQITFFFFVYRVLQS